MNHFINKIIHNIYHTFIHVLIYIHVHHLDNCYFQKKCLHLTYILFHNYTNNKIVKQKAKLQVCPSPEYQRQFMDLTERLVFSFRISIFIVLLQFEVYGGGVMKFTIYVTLTLKEAK